MARIPDQHALGEPNWSSPTSVPRYDASAMAAPGRAKAQKGQAVAKAGKAIGSALSSLASAAQADNQYDTATRFVGFDLAQSDAYREAERNITPDGEGFRSSISESYDTAAREFFATVPEEEKQKYDLMLRKRHVEFEERAREREYKQSDNFHIEDLNKNLEGIYGRIGEEPDDFESLTEHLGRGRYMIENSKLPENRRREVLEKFLQGAEERHIDARKSSIKSLIADPNADIEQVDRLSEELERDIRLRARPVIEPEETSPQALPERAPDAPKTPAKAPGPVSIIEGRIPTSAERRRIFKKGGVVVNLDTNWGGVDKQTSPMVVIPDNATKAQRAAANSYAKSIASLYKKQFGKTLKPRVVTRSKNGRGRSATIHTEPFSVRDSRAVEFFKSQEGLRAHAEIVKSTLGQIPGVQFSEPHDMYGRKDPGATYNGISEVTLARALIAEMKAGGTEAAPELVKQPVRVASLGNEVPESLIAKPDPELAQKQFADDSGQVLSEVTPDATISTILDGVPDGTPLTELPDDVREQVLAALPKDALKKQTQPDGTEVSAADVVTAGEIKEALAAPLKDGRKDEAALKVVENLYTDNPRYRHLSDESRERLLRKLQIDRRAFYLNRAKSELSRIEMFGQESEDSNGDTFLERAERVLTTNQLTKLRLQIEAAHAKYNVVRPIDDMPDDDIDAHIEEYRPLPTDTDAELGVKTQVYKVARAKADKVRALRKKDIAAAVQDSSEVQVALKEARRVRQTYALGQNGSDVESLVLSRQREAAVHAVWESLIEARIEAQERITGDTFDSDDGTISQIRVLTRREAVELLGTDNWSILSEEEKFAHLERAANRADQTYGRYARRAVNDAIKILARDKYTHELAPGVLQKMARGEQISALDRQRYQVMTGLSPVETFMNAGRTPQGFPGGQAADGRRLRGGSQAGPTGQPAIAMTPGAPNQPSLEVMAALLQDPARRSQKFDAVYGPGAAQQVITMFQSVMQGGQSQKPSAPKIQAPQTPALDFGIAP